MIFDRLAFEKACEIVCARYEKTAPTVHTWADSLYRGKDDQITLTDIHLISVLTTDEVHPNTAANLVYHINHRLGRDTTGHAGF
jgi:hypothetical protein